MITIPQPAMVLNSHNVPTPHYRMTNTRSVAADVTPAMLMANVASVLKDLGAKFPGRPRTLVINCHGGVKPERLYLGTGIGIADTVHFTKIASCVDDIFVIACNAGANIDFMGKIARCAKARVRAGVSRQKTNYDDEPDTPCLAFYPPQQVDDWDGPVCLFNPSGKLYDVLERGPGIIATP